MTAILISMAAALLGLIFTVKVGRLYLDQRRISHLFWTLALVFFTVGMICQFFSLQWGWTPLSYRLWYLNGAALTTVSLGLGGVFLQTHRKVSGMLVLALLGAITIAAYLVLSAPVDLSAALAGGSVSGKGMPRDVRLLAYFLNASGVLVLVGGVIRSSGHALWNGGSGRRAAGMLLIAAGALVAAYCGTVAGFESPRMLILVELAGLISIFLGILLAVRPVSKEILPPQELARRRRRIASLAVSGSVIFLFGLVIALPILPWIMGIVTDAKHVVTSTMPEENKGAYLVLDDGFMQLYTWRVEPSVYPSDAPVLDHESVRAIAVVQKQFDPIDNYFLYNLSTNERLKWEGGETDQMRLTLYPPALSPGNYLLVVPIDSMYGGNSYHYFILQ